MEKAPYTYALRAPGKVAVDETRIYRINSFAEGWIIKAHNNPTGSLVKKDEILASYYSRDFITAQQAYFYALDTMERLKQGDELIPDQMTVTSAQVRSAEENLENLGMGKLQIKEIAQNRQLATGNLHPRPGHRLRPVAGRVPGTEAQPELRIIPAGGLEPGLDRGGPLRE